MKRFVLVAALAAAALILAAPTSASAKTLWLCKPGMKHDPCTPKLTTTLFTSLDSQGSVVTPPKTARRFDCFYVYPTVSNQPQTVANRKADPEIKSQALYHAARFSQVCRVFAPLYRQVTIQGLNRRDYGTKARRPGDRDVAAAWKEYLAKYNKGRGFVLIGHSQGSGRLITLIQRQIDTQPAVRRKLISAVLLGGGVTVKQGSDRGGSFQNVPACAASDQIGCVVAYSTFNETPPEQSLFGRTTKTGLQVLCTNPAALGGGPANLDSIFSTTRFAQGYIGAGFLLLRFPLPQVSTPWLEATSAFSGECVTEAGATFLKATSLPGTPTPKASPVPSWGLHILDVNIALGDLVKLVQTQSAAYQAAAKTGSA